MKHELKHELNHDPEHELERVIAPERNIARMDEQRKPQRPGPPRTHSTGGVCGPDELITALERQQRVLDELASLAERQSALIEQRQTDALLALLSRRQGLIEQLLRGQETLGSVSERISGESADVPEPDRARIRALMGTIGDRLAAVMERDAADQAALEIARASSADDRRSVEATQQARSAYRTSDPVNSRFADQRG